MATNCIITAMVAVSFGSYASAAVADSGKVWRFDSGQPNLDTCYTGGTLLLNSYGILTVLDARTGRRAWASKPPAISARWPRNAADATVYAIQA